MILTVRAAILLCLSYFFYNLSSFYYASDINKEYITSILYQIYFYYGEFFDCFNNFLYSGILDLSDEDYLSDDDSDNKTSNEEQQMTVKKEVKFEEKYLEKIRNLNKQGLFTDEDIELENKYISELFQKNVEENKSKIHDLQEEIKNLEKEIKQADDDDYNFVKNNSRDCSDDSDSTEDNSVITREEKKKEKLTEIKDLNDKINEINQIINTSEGVDKLMAQLNELGRNYTLDKYINKVKNTFIMENTPLGNVIMTYNNDRSVFEYYSDHNMPYRFLETVCRKFVLTFNCRPLYVDMEEELKEYERKLEEKEKEEKEQKQKIEETKQEKPKQEMKKHVFAKFKSYNKEAGSGRVNMAPPPKNSIPNTNITKINENEKILLKEHANRYNYQGKIANFSFLKKIDRKIVDKKFAMSFSEYKKSLISKK